MKSALAALLQVGDKVYNVKGLSETCVLYRHQVDSIYLFTKSFGDLLEEKSGLVERFSH